MTNVNTLTRRNRADATRRKIIRAAHDEFLERGFHGATITTIARRAGVASQTVYFVFHTKAALISAVIDDAVLGDEPPTTPQDSQWWSDMLSAESAVEALQSFIRGAAPLFARASGISEVLRAAALTDDELRRTYEAHEDLRAAGFREVIEVLASKGQLHEGLTIETATDLFLTLYGDTTYYLLTRERGWPHETVIEWLCASLPQLLLAPERH